MENLDFSQYILVLAIIAGITELITRIRAKDYWTVLTIVCAVVVGAIFGATGYYPTLDPVEGAALGFGASGAISMLGARKSQAVSRSAVKSSVK